MHWKVKGVVQGILSHLPFGSAVNDQLQLMLGERRHLKQHVHAKVVQDWCVHVGNLRAEGARISGKELLELGTGWLPVLPVCFALAGASRCHSFDLDRKLDLRRVTALLPLLEPLLPQIAEASGELLAEVQDRFDYLRAARDADDMLRRANLVYHAPADARRTGLADRSIDIYFSNSVLEHVDAAALAGLMREAARVVRLDGMVSHSINCGDHYAYFDGRISKLNYLKFSSAEWRRWNNGILYQNRLRPVDFIASAEQAGLTIIAHHWHPNETLLASLPESAIAAEFRRYSRDDLAATSVDILARPRAGNLADKLA